MSQTAVNVNFKLDPDVKKNMESACHDMGITMTAAFTIFAKTVGRERRIPFAVTADPFYSNENINYLEEIRNDIDNGKAHFSEHELLEDDE